MDMFILLNHHYLKLIKVQKGIYIKDENELENYILKNNKELQKVKKGTKNLSKLMKKKNLK